MASPFTALGTFPLGGAVTGAANAALAIAPLLAQIQGLLTAAFGLGPLKADLVAQFNATVQITIAFGDPFIALTGAIAASAQVIAALKAALALGFPPLNLQISANLALSAALQLKIGGINLLIDASLTVRLAGINFLAQLNAALTLGGVALYGWSNIPLSVGANNLLGDIAGHVFAGEGFAGTDLVTGVMLLTKTPGAYGAFSFMFVMPPP